MKRVFNEFQYVFEAFERRIEKEIMNTLQNDTVCKRTMDATQ